MNSFVTWKSMGMPGLMLASTVFALMMFSLMRGTTPLNEIQNPMPVADHTEWSSLSFPPAPSFNWVLIPENQNNGSCLSGTDCCDDIICYGLEYTPGVTGDLTSYTTGFFIECLGGMVPVISNASCIMTDNSFLVNECMLHDSIPVSYTHLDVYKRQRVVR